MTQQIRYSLINSFHFDYAKAVLCFIGDRMSEDRNIVYFARFCQLIYSFCTGEDVGSVGLIESFRLAKRAFADLLKTDNKKTRLKTL